LDNAGVPSNFQWDFGHLLGRNPIIDHARRQNLQFNCPPTLAVGLNGSGTLWWSPNLGSGGEYQVDGLAYNSVPAEDTVPELPGFEDREIWGY
jgi:hypothetical protein